AVFIDQHLGVFNPQLPGFSRNILVDALTQFPLPGDAFEAGHVLVKLYAMHHSLARLRRRTRSRGISRATGFIRHSHPPTGNLSDMFVSTILQDWMKSKPVRHPGRDSAWYWMDQTAPPPKNGRPLQTLPQTRHGGFVAAVP